MQPVFDKLQLLEIPATENHGDPQDEPEAVGDEPEGMQSLAAAPEGLVERVIRRASDLRQEWNAA